MDMQEKGEDRFTGALDQKYTKNMRECGFRLNGMMFFCAHNGTVSRHGVMSNSVVFVTVIIHGSRIMERHSEEKNGHSRSYSAD